MASVKRSWVTTVRHEVSGVHWLALLVLVALLAAALLWGSDLSATTGMFQSPLPTDSSQSPLPTPTRVPPTSTSFPTAPPAPASTATTVPPTATLAAPTATEAILLSTAVPTEVPPTVMPIPATPTQTLVPTIQPAPTRTALPPVPTTTEPDEGASQRYADGDSNLKFEWGMLVDSLALGMSYLWLCCGGLVLLGIPAFFVALWLASKRRQQRGE